MFYTNNSTVLSNLQYHTSKSSSTTVTLVTAVQKNLKNVNKTGCRRNI